MRRKVDSAGDLLPKAALGKSNGSSSGSKAHMRQQTVSLVVGLAMFVAVVFMFSQLVKLSQPNPSEHLSTGDDEGLEQLVDNWSAVDINGKQQSLSQYAGKITIVVNVASKCGFTESNYKGLEKLYEKYKWHGLEVLAFPCNQFGAQEPGTCKEILDFAQQRFQVTFPMFDKANVNGPDAHEVYKFLKSNLPAAQGGGKELAWNFQKFIVNRQGQPVKLHTQAWDQAAIERDVYDLLRQQPAVEQAT
eukprot:gene6210-6446_t